jgi:hypothetical protein
MSIINFGKYKNKTIDQINEEDSHYLIYLMNCGFLKKDQSEYILQNYINDVKVGFGKYKESTFGELKVSNPKYLNWMSENTRNTWVAQLVN